MKTGETHKLTLKFKGAGNPFFGKHHSLETKLRISKSLKGTKLKFKNPMWKGNGVGYVSLHEYVRKIFPKPNLCQNCNQKPALDLANKGIYDRNPNNWEWLCRSCHIKKDGRINNLWKGIEDRSKWKPPKARYGKESSNWKGGIKSLDPIGYRRNWQMKNYWMNKSLS